MCSKPLAAFNGLAQKRDEFTKQLVNLKKNNEKKMKRYQKWKALQE